MAATMNKLMKTNHQVRCAHIARALNPLYNNILFDYMPSISESTRNGIEILNTFRPNLKVMMNANNTPLIKRTKSIDHVDQTVYLCNMERNEYDTIYYLAYEQIDPQYITYHGEEDRIVYNYTYEHLGSSFNEAILRFMELNHSKHNF